MLMTLVQPAHAKGKLNVEHYALEATLVEDTLEATLVVELRDSVSDTTLARMVDRRAAERPGGGGFHSNAATNMGEVRQLARSWARLLRQRLDELPTLYKGVVVTPAAEEPGGE